MRFKVTEVIEVTEDLSQLVYLLLFGSEKVSEVTVLLTGRHHKFVFFSDLMASNGWGKTGLLIRQHLVPCGKSAQKFELC